MTWPTRLLALEWLLLALGGALDYGLYAAGGYENTLTALGRLLIRWFPVTAWTLFALVAFGQQAQV